MKSETKQTRTFILVGGKLCLDFINTVGNYGAVEKRSEYLKDYKDLIDWSRQAGIFSDEEAKKILSESVRHPAKASAALENAIEFREAIYRIFSSIVSKKTFSKNDLKILNRQLNEAMSRSQIVQTAEGFAWEWTQDKQAFDSMLWRVARSAAELLISGDELSRLKECSDHICRWLFLDASKNRSRRWCEMRDCGSRAKSRRFYERSKIARNGQSRQ